jgi:hypothetical protein
MLQGVMHFHDVVLNMLQWQNSLQINVVSTLIVFLLELTNNIQKY